MGESLYGIMKEKGIRDEFLDKTNYEAVGGSPIIGVNGNVIIAHGSSSATAFDCSWPQAPTASRDRARKVGKISRFI